MIDKLIQIQISLIYGKEYETKNNKKSKSSK